MNAWMSFSGLNEWFFLRITWMNKVYENMFPEDKDGEVTRQVQLSPGHWHHHAGDRYIYNICQIQSWVIGISQVLIQISGK